MSEQRAWDRLPDLARAVRVGHYSVGITGGAHDFLHAARVADVAGRLLVGDVDERILNLAMAGGFCHNADRVLQYTMHAGHRKDVHRDKVAALITDWLSAEPRINRADWPLVIADVLAHDQGNFEGDPITLQALRDADRYVGVGAEVVMRAGQFYHDKPAVSPYLLHEPGVSFREPGSVLRDIDHNCEWESGTFGLRLSRAKQMARERFAYLRSYMERVKKEWAEDGLGDGIETFPFPLP